MSDDSRPVLEMKNDCTSDAKCAAQLNAKLRKSGVVISQFELLVSTMRTIEEYRKRQLERLPFALARPGMHCPQDFAPDRHFWSILSDLCWIDEREAEWDRVEKKCLWRCSRVIGQLHDQPVCMPEYLNEITSTWAQIAWVLGYFRPERLLTLAEWNSLKSSLNADFFNREWLASQIEERFGLPSHRVLGGFTTVAAYACEDPAEDWVFMDYARKLPTGDHWYPDERLRDVRIERNRFQLLPDANWCRRFERIFPHPVGRDQGLLQIGVVSLKGDHLNVVTDLLSQSGYRVERTFAVEEGERVSQELAWRGGPRAITVAAYLDNGWTHIVDSEMALMANDSLLAYSAERETQIFAWSRDFGCCGFTFISEGRRLRDVLYCDGGVVDRGQRLPEELNLDWSQAAEEDVLAIAARFGAPYDFLADRKYLVFRVDQTEKVNWG